MPARAFAFLCLLSACAREPSPPPAQLGGTQWRFPAGKVALPGAEAGGNTVTFREDGTVHFGGLPAGAQTGGHWQRDGNELVFDCNDFTEYRVVIDGNRMSGQWKRLKGDDQGRSYATSLERLTGG